MLEFNRKEFLSSIWNWVKSMFFLPWFFSIACRGETMNQGVAAESGNSGTLPRAAFGPGFIPSYLELHASGELKRRGEELWSLMEECRLCPRECGTNRLQGEEGFCGSTERIKVASHNPHFGEERPLVGQGGSGTVFMSNCSLRCVFCINWQISQGGRGRYQELDKVADMMLSLQEQGCHNINIVTPTHYSPHVLLALDLAASRGLRLPLVYNTCGWEKVDILKQLDGVVDIYLPDFKYSDPDMAVRYSEGAENYPEVTKLALLEMHRQVGTARPAPDRLMYRGLMIRHLVMPNNVSGTREVIRWIAENLPRDTYLNIMAQYHPMYRASRYPDINRRLNQREYREAVRWAQEMGLTNLDTRSFLF
ncbi:MAG: radical SAM protein [Acidobacteriota bacterium]